MVDVLHMVRDMRHIRHMLRVSPAGLVFRLRLPCRKGDLASSSRCGGMVGTSSVDGDMNGDAISVVGAREPWHGGCCASESSDAQSEDVCKLHFELYWKRDESISDDWDGKKMQREQQTWCPGKEAYIDYSLCKTAG